MTSDRSAEEVLASYAANQSIEQMSEETPIKVGAFSKPVYQEQKVSKRTLLKLELHLGTQLTNWCVCREGKIGWVQCNMQQIALHVVYFRSQHEVGDAFAG